MSWFKKIDCGASREGNLSTFRPQWRIFAVIVIVAFVGLLASPSHALAPMAFYAAASIIAHAVVLIGMYLLFSNHSDSTGNVVQVSLVDTSTGRVETTGVSTPNGLQVKKSNDGKLYAIGSGSSLPSGAIFSYPCSGPYDPDVRANNALNDARFYPAFVYVVSDACPSYPSPSNTVYLYDRVPSEFSSYTNSRAAVLNTDGSVTIAAEGSEPEITLSPTPVPPPSPAVETIQNSDGSTTKKTTNYNLDGSVANVVYETTYPDGWTNKITKYPDGSVSIDAGGSATPMTTQNTDGTQTIVTRSTNPDGSITSNVVTQYPDGSSTSKTVRNDVTSGSVSTSTGSTDSNKGTGSILDALKSFFGLGDGAPNSSDTAMNQNQGDAGFDDTLDQIQRDSITDKITGFMSNNPIRSIFTNSSVSASPDVCSFSTVIFGKDITISFCDLADKFQMLGSMILIVASIYSFFIAWGRA